MLCRRKQEEAWSSRVDGGTEENRLMVDGEAPSQGEMADAASVYIQAAPSLWVSPPSFHLSLARKTKEKS